MMMIVADVIDKKKNEMFTIGADDTLQDALEIMAAEEISSLPVVDDAGHLIGIISERDYIRKAAPKKIAPWDLVVKDYMTKDVITVTKNHVLRECMKIMSGERIRHLPVMEDHKMIGMLSITDVVRALRNLDV